MATESETIATRGQYSKIKQIGSGSFGRVFTVKDKATGDVYVSKKVDLGCVDVSSLAANDYTVVFRGQDFGGAGPPEYFETEGVLQDTVEQPCADFGILSKWRFGGAD